MELRGDSTTSSGARRGFADDMTELEMLRRDCAAIGSRFRAHAAHRAASHQPRHDSAFVDEARLMQEAYEQGFREKVLKVSERGKFIGAVVAAIIGSVLFGVAVFVGNKSIEESQTRVARQIAFEADLFQKQADAIKTFGDEFPAAAFRAQQLQQGQLANIELRATVASATPDAYEGLRARYDMQVEAWQQGAVKEYISKPNVISLAATADAFFGEGVRRDADALRAHADALMSTTSREELDTSYDALSKQYYAVLHAMSGEVQSSKERLASLHGVPEEHAQQPAQKGRR